MAKIPWKSVPIETTLEDGTVLKGVLHYWDKDFEIVMTHPFKKRVNRHLMYMIPVMFVYEPEKPAYYEKAHSKNSSTRYINLFEESKEWLKKLVLVQ